MKLVVKDGKLFVKDGKLVGTDSSCICCDVDCPDLQFNPDNWGGTFTKVYKVPVCEGMVTFTWECNTDPETFTVSAGNATLLSIDTCKPEGVDSNGQKSFCKPAGVTELTVTVKGDPTGAWTYSISCPVCDAPCEPPPPQCPCKFDFHFYSPNECSDEQYDAYIHKVGTDWKTGQKINTGPIDLNGDPGGCCKGRGDPECKDGDQWIRGVEVKEGQHTNCAFLVTVVVTGTNGHDLGTLAILDIHKEGVAQACYQFGLSRAPGPLGPDGDMILEAEIDGNLVCGPCVARQVFHAAGHLSQPLSHHVAPFVHLDHAKNPLP